MSDNSRVTAFYDADCGICQASVNRMKSFDIDGRLKLVPYQTPGLAEQYPNIDFSGVNRGVYALLSTGELLKSEVAMAAILKVLPQLSWLSGMIMFPLIRPFSALFYRAFAANRRRISALLGLNQCAMPAVK